MAGFVVVGWSVPSVPWQSYSARHEWMGVGRLGGTELAVVSVCRRPWRRVGILSLGKGWKCRRGVWTMVMEKEVGCGVAI